MPDLLEPTSVNARPRADECAHRDTAHTPYFREDYCFTCESFIDVVTGEIAPDASERTVLDDEIERVQHESFTHLGWPRLLDAALIFAMGNPNRAMTRSIFTAHRAWVKACERGGD